MKTRLFRHIGVALASTLVLSSLALAPISAPVTVQAAPVTVTIDPNDMNSVQDAYFDVFLANLNVDTGWTGDIAACQAGTATPEAIDATVNVINYYRVLAGLDPVTENTDATARAQQAALLVTANSDDYLNPNSTVDPHHPPTSWLCYNSIGATSAGLSNLGGGYATGGKSIQDYMVDTEVPSVGHRTAVLYPPLSQVGVGMVGNSWPIGYALEWNGTDLDTNTSKQGTAVAWPSQGYFPYQSLPSNGCLTTLRTNGCWSYSIYNKDFNAGSGTTVTVTKNDDSTNLVTSISSARNNRSDGAIYKPDATLIWTMPPIDAPAAGTVDTYHVTISGAVNTSYDVKVFTAVQQATMSSVTITGAASDGSTPIGTTLTAVADGITPTGATASYTWYREGTIPPIGTGATYTVGLADAGKKLTVQATASTPGWTASSVATSDPVTVEALVPTSGKVTSSDGTVPAGTTITINNVTCDTHVDITTPDQTGDVTVYEDGTFSFNAIPGQCYKLTAIADADPYLATVNGQKDFDYVPAGSTDVAVTVNQVALDKVTIPDTVAVGQTVPATLGTAWPDTVSIGYEWYRDDDSILLNATSSTYTVTAADYGHKLSVKATASDGVAAVHVTSNQATVGLGSIDFKPAINGTPTVGQLLTTTTIPDGWTPKYQWLSGGTPILGATQASYTLVPDDANTDISVRVTMTRSGYNPVDATSDIVHVQALHSVTFDAQNGDTSIVKSVADGGTVTLPPAPAKAGNTFGGWLMPDGKTFFTETTPVTADITVTASWTPIPTYTVTYDANGGTGTTTDTKTYHTGDPVTIVANGFTRDGYTFASWNTMKDGTGTTYAPQATLTIGTTNVTLFAQWTQNSTPPAATYTVTYDANGGSGTTVDTATYPSGSIAQVKASTFTREGYTFTGWKDAAGNSYAPDAPITMTGNVTLFAQWQKNDVLPGTQFTLSFDANGGTGTMTAVQYPVGAIVKAPENGFTLDGYTFTEWNTAKDGKGQGYSVAASFELDSNVTLYAQWVASTAPETPAQPGTGTPAQPGTGTPAQPGTGTPAQPGAQTPAQAVSKVPSGGSTDSSSMLILLELGLLVAGVAVLRLRKTI